MPTAYVVRDDARRSPADDIQLSRQLLAAVSARTEPTRVVRLYRPRPTVAMTARERLMPGFERACAAARSHGFKPVIRLTGGRAVAYDESSLVVELFDAEPATVAKPSHRDVFATVGESFVTALTSFGIDARVGPVPGEYCPGDFSVNARGVVKLVGTAQRVVRGGRLVGASLALEETERLRTVLEEVNGLLGLEWDPTTLGGAAAESAGFTEEGFTAALVSLLAPAGIAAPDIAAVLETRLSP